LQCPRAWAAARPRAACTQPLLLVLLLRGDGLRPLPVPLHALGATIPHLPARSTRCAVAGAVVGTRGAPSAGARALQLRPHGPSLRAAARGRAAWTAASMTSYARTVMTAWMWTARRTSTATRAATLTACRGFWAQAQTPHRATRACAGASPCPMSPTCCSPCACAPTGAAPWSSLRRALCAAALASASWGTSSTRPLTRPTWPFCSRSTLAQTRACSTARWQWQRRAPSPARPWAAWALCTTTTGTCTSWAMCTWPCGACTAAAPLTPTSYPRTCWWTAQRRTWVSTTQRASFTRAATSVSTTPWRATLPPLPTCLATGWTTTPSCALRRTHCAPAPWSWPL
jgi:hypothetical protein